MLAPLNFVGFNASLTFPGDPNTQADHIRRMNGAYNVLCTVGTAQRALDFKNSMPENEFIDRLVEDGDGNYWRSHTPQQMVDKYAVREGRGKLIRYVLNEPGIASNPPENSKPDEPQQIQTFVQWCVDVLDKGAAIGERYVIGSLWAGTPHESWVSGGYFDPLIRALDRHYDKHFLGLHEGQPFITAGREAVKLNYAAMKDIGQMQESQWGDPATTPTDNAWMVGRCWQWGKRAIQIGCRPPKIILTEFTPAQNAQDGAQDLYRYFTGKYGVYRGRYMDGIPTLINVYRAYYGDNWIKVLRNSLAWDAAFYPANVVGKCPYAYNFQDIWIEFNIGVLIELLEYLFANPIPFPTRTYGTTPPLPVHPRFRIVAPNGVNLRSEPRIADNVIGILANGTVIDFLEEYAIGGGYVWFEASSNIGTGWVANPYVRVVT